MYPDLFAESLLHPSLFAFPPSVSLSVSFLTLNPVSLRPASLCRLPLSSCSLLVLCSPGL